MPSPSGTLRQLPSFVALSLERQEELGTLFLLEHFRVNKWLKTFSTPGVYYSNLDTCSKMSSFFASNDKLGGPVHETRASHHVCGFLWSFHDISLQRGVQLVGGQ